MLHSVTYAKKPITHFPSHSTFAVGFLLTKIPKPWNTAYMYIYWTVCNSAYICMGPIGTLSAFYIGPARTMIAFYIELTRAISTAYIGLARILSTFIEYRLHFTLDQPDTVYILIKWSLCVHQNTVYIFYWTQGGDLKMKKIFWGPIWSMLLWRRRRPVLSWPVQCMFYYPQSSLK